MAPRRTLKANRLNRLPNGALAAPSHALAKLIHLSIRARYPISRPRSVPDVLAGPILASEVGGPKCKIWGAIDLQLDPKLIHFSNNLSTHTRCKQIPTQLAAAMATAHICTKGFPQ